eukprot:CAMPEP_0194482204 /NCGR_PEP_ID=MMETSP0253-20130528/4268_1 /TAXON_ID=2966 /ORGANISM="Noctiluca scintillans" /LENGTH=72 /DNA_ID=CAMNT_0039321729 /DNA_START=359 /DNA_END=577 /DNA_ORIENTATION=-
MSRARSIIPPTWPSKMFAARGVVASGGGPKCRLNASQSTQVPLSQRPVKSTITSETTTPRKCSAASKPATSS